MIQGHYSSKTDRKSVKGDNPRRALYAKILSIACTHQEISQECTASYNLFSLLHALMSQSLGWL